MKKIGVKLSQLFLQLVIICSLTISTVFAQSTTFTYQGRLQDGQNAANGNFSMVFYLYDAAVNGSQLGNVSVLNVLVTNGLFTTSLDFGNAFTGSSRWLEISVKTNGAASFTTLSPRQPITSTPYAIYAPNAGAANILLGTLPSSQLTGTLAADKLSGSYNQALILTNFNNSFGGTFNGTSIGLFTGGFSGNGAGLTNLQGTFRWNVVSGTSATLTPNTGTIVTNDSLVTLTLPTSPSVGDVLRVSGTGSAGWQILLTSNQTSVAGNILTTTSTVPGVLTWTARNTNRSWSGVASSSDGVKIAAIEAPGFIYTSTDSGITWTQRQSSRNWSGIASSSDGTKLMATDSSAGAIYTSTDAGANWTSQLSGHTWTCIAGSSDFTKLIAGDSGGFLYVSINSGTNWTTRAAARQWRSVAASADGTRMYAVNFINGAEAGQIYTSTDSGTTWIPRESSRNWVSVACSSDGTKVIAADFSTGLLYTSVNSGTNFTSRASNRNWLGVASSADGNKLAAVENGGFIYLSPDSGVTWGTTATNRAWRAIASSSDGTKYVAPVINGAIYTGVYVFPASTNIFGAQYSTIELQYIGSGKYLPLSFRGTVNVN